MKKFLIKTNYFIFAITFIFLSLSFTLQSALLKTLSTGFSKNEIVDKVIMEISNSIDDFNLIPKEEIKKAIYDSPEIEMISSIFFETLLNDIKNDTVSNVNIEKEINSLLNNNLRNIPKIYHDQIRNKVNSIDYNKLYVNILNYIKNKSTEEIKTTINVYNIMINLKTRILGILIILITFIMVLFLTKPKLNIINGYGITLSIVGGLLILILFMVRQVTSYLIAASYGVQMGVDFTALTIVSFGTLVVGMIMTEVYKEIEEKRANK